MISLDRNESYWLLDEELAEAASIADGRVLSLYPDYSQLETALAAYAGVKDEQLLITPGSDAAIEHIARTYSAGNRSVVLPVPTFYGYESILERVGAHVIPVIYEIESEQFIFPIDKTIEALKHHKPSILFLCHPNNPLGCPLSPDDVSRLAEAARGNETLIVSDEAYFEFSQGRSFQPYLDALDNLIIIRTLSKSFGLAGARVGYVIAATAMIEVLRKQLLPWPVSHASVASSLALINRARRVSYRRNEVIQGRQRFIEALERMTAVRVYPSQTNFVLIRVPGAAHMRAALLERGIRVALAEPMSHVKEAAMLLKDTLRIAVPSPHDIPLVISAMSRILTM